MDNHCLSFDLKGVTIPRQTLYKIQLFKKKIILGVDEIYLNNNIQSEEICILAPKNVDVKSINEEALQKLLPDQIVRKFFSIDTVMSDEETEHLNFTTEYLNSITPSGMPHHELNLKVGCIIMLLRNINSKLGLCNGIK